MKERNILVVGTEEYLISKIKLILELNQYNVFHLETGNSAIYFLSCVNILPDLIIVPVFLKDMDCIDLMVLLSCDIKTSHIPFIFVSFIEDQSNESYLYPFDSDDYAFKPIKEETFLETIKRKIDVKRQIETDLVRKVNFDPFLVMENITGFNSSLFLHSKIFLFVVEVDDFVGPVIMDMYSENPLYQLILEDLVTQINKTIIHQSKNPSGSFYISLKNLNLDVLMIFEKITNNELSTRLRNISIGVIAPEISFYNSIKLKSVLLRKVSEMKYNNYPNLFEIHSETYLTLV